MDPKRQDAMRFIARGLGIYGSLPATELVTRIMGDLTGGEEEAWDVVAEGERIGMIERVDMVFRAVMPNGQEWRLVEGFDMKKLEMPA